MNSQMFNRFFRPKWQHRDPAVRLSALRELAGDTPQVLELARHDGDATVRQQAIRQLSDLDALFSLYSAEADRQCREVAGKRLKRLLCSADEATLPMPERLAALQRFAHEELIGEVLLQTAEVEMRRQLLEQVQRPSLLAEVALGDEVAELRLRALERIERPQTLERIARQARGRDKGIARLARERLEALRAEEERPRRRLEVCATMERLVEQGAVDLVAFRRLQEEWQGLAAGGDDALCERFATALAAFERGQEARREEALQLLRQRELCERCEQLLQGIAAHPELNGIDTAMEMLELSWSGIVAEGREPNPGLAARFHDSLRQLKECVRDLRAAERERHTLQSLLDEANTLCSNEAQLSEAAIARIEERWGQSGGRRTTQNSHLHDAFASACARGRAILVQQREEALKLEQEIVAILNELEQVLREGQLQSAISLSDRVQDRINRLEGHGSSRLKGFSRRLAQARGRLHELRDWRRFGTNQAREELLARMETLPGSGLAVRALAAEIKGLQQAWRELDRKDGVAPEALWQRFEQASEAAYAPCRAHHEEQERQREESYEARSRFLEELEQGYDAIDWEKPAWEAIDKSLRRAHQRWRDLGGVGPEQWQVLNGRFRTLAGRFEEPIERQREKEVARREGLILLVTRLADEADLSKALEQTREAQGQWRPQVTALPRVEQRLWRRFKAACDAVYARQRSEQQVRRSEEQENAARKSALCERLEQLAGEPHESWERARHEAASIRQEWGSIGKLSAAAHKALEARLQRAEKAFDTADLAASEARQRVEMAQLQQRMHACEALEVLLWQGGDEALLAAAEAQWNALAPLSGAIAEVLQGRFVRTLQALRQGAAAAIEALKASAEDNLRQAEALLLQMEILAGLDSPAAFATERLAMQVELLPAAMTHRLERGEQMQQLAQLRLALMQLGPLPPASLPPLHARWEAVGARLG